jgi:hypothetical protein
MRARVLVLRSVAVGLLTTTAACSLVASFDGFAGPGDAPEGSGDASRGPDASQNPGVDGGGLDANDSATPEVDAGDPNTPPIFVDGGSFCGAQDGATFCEDFDTADLPVRWVQEGLFARLTSYSPKSAPNGLLLDVAKSDIGGTFVSKITHVFTAPSTNLMVAFDFKPEKVNLGSSFLILAALEWAKSETAKYSMRLVYSNGSVRLEESNLVPPPNNKDAYHPFFTLPNGKWTRIKLDVVASGGTPGVTLSLDGTTVGARETIAPTVNLDPTPTLILGAVFAGNPHTGWTLRYDDVTVTYR